jgi:hypothetical protein
MVCTTNGTLGTGAVLRGSTTTSGTRRSNS